MNIKYNKQDNKALLIAYKEANKKADPLAYYMSEYEYANRLDARLAYNYGYILSQLKGISI